MEFPENRREQIVMGLSICALILFLANLATFVKQRFLQDEHQVHHAFVASGIHAGEAAGEVHHEWHAQGLSGGDTAWTLGEDIDCQIKRVQERVERLERDGLTRDEERVARYAWRIKRDVVRPESGQ